MNLVSCDECYTVFDADKILDEDEDQIVCFGCPVCTTVITIYRAYYEN